MHLAFGPLSGEVEHPAGASPSKYIYIFIRQNWQTQGDDHAWQITPEMAALAAALPGRDWGVACAADHQWLLEESWAYNR
jgi:hypothetical protein